MRIYVASAFVNKTEVRSIMRDLVDAGHEISHDWTQHNADGLERGSREYYEHLERLGRQDFEGVFKADALVLVAHPEMRDARAELGMALALDTPCFVLYPERAHSIFYCYVERMPSVDALIADLASGVWDPPSEFCP